MTQLINVFRIGGLELLSAAYRIADVVGLDKEQADYFRSTDRLTSLSRTLRRPVSFMELGDAPVIVYPDGTPIPTTLDLGSRILSLNPRSDAGLIDFSRSSEFDPIRLRIVRFTVEEHLRATETLWQPSAGQAFFQREPWKIEGGVGLYFGTRLRPMVLPDGGVGLCIDKRSHLIATQSLPKFLSREAFEDHWKGQRCIYHYGDAWYQIRCDMLARHVVAEYPIRQAGGLTNLLKFLLDNVAKPVPKYVANLDPGGSVLVYRNARGEERAAPTELCFAIRDTDDVRRTGLGRATIIEPSDRIGWSREFVRSHLKGVRIGDKRLSIELEPMRAATKRFPVPDLRFGAETTVSVNSSPGARHASLQDLGRFRLQLLQDSQVGPLVTTPFDRQYLILPKSAAASFGAAYESDLRAAVRALHPRGGYRPTVVTYDDTCRRTFVDQAQAIRAAFASISLPGFAVAMIHRCKSRRRMEDALAAFVLRGLKQEADTIASVVHYDTAERLYEVRQSASGERGYQIRHDKRSRATGYFRNVALNKVLLSNQVWPFGLSQPLHADLTIGIDVKNNACCLLAACERGQRISSHVQISKQKEKLNSAQLCGLLCEVIGQKANQSTEPIRRIVLHRDGRAWPSEISGARRALERLKTDGVLPCDTTLTVVEIHKRASVPLRIFDCDSKRGSVRKPRVGDTLLAEPEAFVCTTGWPFLRPGTPNPLQVQRVYGPLPIEQCAQDVFSLSTLAWTRPEDCSRYPVTLRLADRFLADEASEYDEDELIFSDGYGLEEEGA